MKTKMVLALALGLAGVTALPAAMADGLFISGNVGQSDLKKGDFDKDTAFAINGGYRWGAFGLEAGYNDFGSFENKYVLDNAKTREEQEACVDAVRFKCNVLWVQLDALQHAYVEGNVPPGAFRPQ